MEAVTDVSTPSPKIEQNAHVPEHVAVIMDGNGRWAERRGKARQTGHRAGVKAARDIVETMADRGVRYLTLFAFSSENWGRPREEVVALMSLFSEVLKRETAELHKNGVCLRFIGDRSNLGRRLNQSITAAEQLTADNTRLFLSIAMAYGGRWDIVNAVQQIAARAADGSLDVDDIDEDCFAAELASAPYPDPDLLIRTGGEHRVSNFLLWQLAYAEVFFSPTLWPDYSAADVDAALEFFASRHRRFGQTSEQLEAR